MKPNKPLSDKRISKFLSLVLRHAPERIELKLDEAGWANVDELLKKMATKGIKIDFDRLEHVVVTNDKKRYAFNESQTKIRASQGHSIEIDLQLIPQQPPEILYHGTATKNLSSIFEKGLIKGNRQHVHLSADKETALRVGQRHGKPVILTILSGKMHEAGIEFFLSENKVWLTDSVDRIYIEQRD